MPQCKVKGDSQAAGSRPNRERWPPWAVAAAGHRQKAFFYDFVVLVFFWGNLGADANV